jgi:hypothetical protein
MRTTPMIERDIYATAKQIAENSGRGLGEVISQLARKGLAAEPSFEIKNGVLCSAGEILQSGFLGTERRSCSMRRMDGQIPA